MVPEVVFFGGTVPGLVVDECYQMIDAAEGMLVVGSSLSVYSGLRFCRYTVGQGKPLIILNQGQTRADDLCTRVSIPLDARPAAVGVDARRVQ